MWEICLSVEMLTTPQLRSSTSDNAMNKYPLSKALALMFCSVPFGYAWPGYQQNAICASVQAALCSTMPVDLPNLIVNAGYVPNTNTTPPSSDVSQDNFDWYGW